MATCKVCGGEIIFRHVDGAITPIHLSGGCPGPSPSGSRASAVQVKEFEHSRDFCRENNCPICHRRAFFIRHNGGSVWVDELGWPWPKHPCFDHEPQTKTVFDGLAADSDKLRSPKGAVVLRVGFVPGNDECYALIATPTGKPTVWHVFDIADPQSLVGNLVVFSPEEKQLVFRGVVHRIAIPRYRCFVCERLFLSTELDEHVRTAHQLRRCEVCECYVRESSFDEHLHGHRRDERQRRTARRVH